MADSSPYNRHEFAHFFDADDDGVPPDFKALPTRDQSSRATDPARGAELDATIELSRTRMAMEDVLKLRAGAIVPLDNLSGDPVDVIINGRLVARGEVVVVEDTFCVRIVELIPAAKAA